MQSELAEEKLLSVYAEEKNEAKNDKNKAAAGISAEKRAPEVKSWLDKIEKMGNWVQDKFW